VEGVVTSSIRTLASAAALAALLALPALPAPTLAAGPVRADDGQRPGTSAVAAPPGTHALGGPASSVGLQRAARRVVVDLAPGVSAADAAASLARAGFTVVGSLDRIGAVVVDAGSAAARDGVLARLAGDPRFASVEPAHVYRASADPNDPMLAAEWWLTAIDVRPWWDWPAPATPVTIAIVDTGVDLTQPDLAPLIVPGRNFVTAGAPPQDDSTIGHGTHVAGIAAAETNDGIGMAGVASGARILPVKVLDADGYASDDMVAAGITWAADQGARVVNLSMEGGMDDPCPTVMTDAVAYARSKGAVVVASTGNHASAVTCPARIPGVLAVGAVDESLTIWGKSNRGPQISLVAPGVAIKSTLPTAMGSYGQLTGTSMAAPMVSGAAAILAMAAPGLGEEAIRNALTSTARDLGFDGFDQTYGAGLVDVGKALRAAAQPVSGVAATPGVLVLDGEGAGAAATLSFDVVVPVDVTVAVESSTGAVVRQLSTGPLTVGPHSFTWDGRDEGGARVPDGDYRFAIRGTAPGAVPIAVTLPIAVSSSLLAAKAVPAAISPNGDGRADRSKVTFTLRSPARVTVKVLDAAGRTVRTLSDGQRATGASSVIWDGRRTKSASSVVPDGTYAIAIVATTAEGTRTVTVPVTVSVRGVAVASIAATTVFPAADGYRDTSSITFTQGGSAVTTVFIYPKTSATAIRSLPQGRVQKGKFTATWDGRDARGRAMAAGTYRVRVRTVDAAGVTRWSAWSTVGVSAKRLVKATFTATLRGDERDPRSFGTSPSLTSVSPSDTLTGGLVLRSDSPDERAVGLWVFSHPSWTSVTSVRVTVDARRTGTGDASIGTWGAMSIDPVGPLPDGSGTSTYSYPTEKADPRSSSLAVAIEQLGPGSTDVASVTVTILYAVLR
jgi:subtilisin family serine protease